MGEDTISQMPQVDTDRPARNARYTVNTDNIFYIILSAVYVKGK